MDIVETLLGFIDTAKSERKYADSTSRGFKAAVKLFAPNLNNTERSSFDTLLQNLDSIAGDIYAKHADENITVTTLVVYKRRIAKLVEDFRLYGTDPAKMAGWNPRRISKGLKPRPSEPNATREPTDDTESRLTEQTTSVSIQPIKVTDTGAGGIKSIDLSQKGIALNRSEIFLRPEFKFTLELPVDLTESEANKIKSLIDLMTLPG